ncbi:hypothetical protein Tsubulata_007889 [Turnera subulata]|uniref:S-acyltransferase n=1 Tax=Turnera subulata TaxID=218843 RepID=A0A9Q0FQ76_9ROSI|nr:hypothetical protein Tsubulata_007889 [Turnera subulata]
MIQFQFEDHHHSIKKKRKQLLNCAKIVGRFLVSLVLVLLAHSALLLVPLFFSSSASSLLLQLILSGLVLLLATGVGRWCRRLVGVFASAPALVFFNVLFIWGVYLFLVQRAVSRFMNVVFNVEIALLLLGLCRILSSDPGVVTYESSISEDEVCGAEAYNKGSKPLNRVRYCRSCKAYIKGFDHHCPAFGNCIGQNNYVLFMVLLVGFVASEVSYIVCLSHFSRESQILGGTVSENNVAESLVISTKLFCLLQVLWQGLFVMWHVYCICSNIRTDEWINWTRYPEFQSEVQSQRGESFTGVVFRNPYDKGILHNVKEFLGIES